MEYAPRPVNTSSVELPAAVLALSERIAENAHEVWSQQRIQGGWRWGPVRCNDTKQHPDLVPYSQLTEQDKQYDRDMSLETIKLIYSLGYKIQQASERVGTDPLQGKAVDGCHTALACGSRYTPCAVDTSDVTLCAPLMALANKLAQNAHDVWASKRIEQGWRYGPKRDDANKLHNCLLPYLCLSESERDMDLATAKEALKVVVKMGCRIVPDNSNVKTPTVSEKRTREHRSPVYFPRSTNLSPAARRRTNMKRVMSRSTSLDVDHWCRPTLLRPTAV